jgi:hypothetical protein
VRAKSETPGTDELPARARPIEFLTENGFSIIRPWELDRAAAPTNGTYAFLVRDPREQQRQIVVFVTDALVAQVALQTRGRVRLQSSFWIVCAERHLADYLSEADDFPPGDKFLIADLYPEDLISAIRWRSG